MFLKYLIINATYFLSTFRKEIITVSLKASHIGGVMAGVFVVAPQFDQQSD